MGGGELYGSILLGLVVLGLVLLVVWIILPFAIIGTKPILWQILLELRKQTALLEQRLPDLGRRERPPSVRVEPGE